MDLVTSSGESVAKADKIIAFESYNPWGLSYAPIPVEMYIPIKQTACIFAYCK